MKKKPYRCLSLCFQNNQHHPTTKPNCFHHVACMHSTLLPACLPSLLECDNVSDVVIHLSLSLSLCLFYSTMLGTEAQLYAYYLIPFHNVGWHSSYNNVIFLQAQYFRYLSLVSQSSPSSSLHPHHEGVCGLFEALEQVL